jgi:hypothetical protein
MVDPGRALPSTLLAFLPLAIDVVHVARVKPCAPKADRLVPAASTNRESAFVIAVEPPVTVSAAADELPPSASNATTTSQRCFPDRTAFVMPQRLVVDSYQLGIAPTPQAIGPMTRGRGHS